MKPFWFYTEGTSLHYVYVFCYSSPHFALFYVNRRQAASGREAELYLALWQARDLFIYFSKWRLCLMLCHPWTY